MNRLRWIVVTIVLMLVIIGGSFVLRMIGLEQEQSTLRQQVETETARAEAAAAELSGLASTDADLDARIEVAAGMVDSRKLFIEQVAAASAALDSANGRIDVAAHRQRAIDAQTAVLAATDAAGIDAQTAAVKAIVAEVNSAVEAYNAAQRLSASRETAPASASARRTSGAPSPATPPGGSDWLSAVRGILDSVGGGHIALQAFDGNCGGVQVVACSKRGLIMVTPSFIDKSRSYQIWAMTHELAHQYQFAVWKPLKSSPTYQSLFGSNIELLANCMATVRGQTFHGLSCSEQQLAFASNIWNGVVG